MGEHTEAVVERLKHRMKYATPERKLDAALGCLKEQRDVIDLILSIFEEEEEKTKCPVCGGAGMEGRYRTTAEDHFLTRHWESCGQCGGKGYLEGEERHGREDRTWKLEREVERLRGVQEDAKALARRVEQLTDELAARKREESERRANEPE